jgi:P4 family phage/plasmid primase-like protien
LVEITNETDNSISRFEKDNTSDKLIYSFLESIKNESIGYQNLVLGKLAKKLEYYGKNDLKRMLKSILEVKSDDDTEAKIYLQIGDDVLEEFAIITLEDSEQIMLFNSGHYEFNHTRLDSYISNRIREFNAPHRYTYGEVIDYIKKSTLFPRSKLNYDPNIIVFKNGVYGLDVNEFYPHVDDEAGAWHYFFQIPHNYESDKRYRCPKFKNLIRQWLSLPFSKARVQDIFEAIGLCMTINISFKTAFMNYGEPHTGKTQFFNIVKHIIGEENMAAVSLQRITKNEFGTLALQFMLLNYCSDLGSRKIRDTSVFKNHTGGDDLVWAEIKGGKSFGFKPTSKFWFNANKIPAIEDIDDDAFFERFILFLFGNQFTKENTKKFQLDFYKMIVQNREEVQGIIHEAIRGFKRLQKRKGFRTKLKENTKHVWNYESNQIYAYVHDFCIEDREEFIRSELLYSHYVKNCRGVAQTKNIFTKGLQIRGIVKKPMTKKNEAGKRPECYYGIQLKHKEEEVIPITSGRIDFDEILRSEEKKGSIQNWNRDIDYSDPDMF